MMRISKKSRRLSAALAVSAALLTVGASSAMAAPALWSPTSGYATMSGTLTLTASGSPTKVCPITVTIRYVGSDWGTNPYQQYPNCGAGQLPVFWVFSRATVNGGAYSLEMPNTGPYTYTVSPWGTNSQYTQDPWTAPFTNGTALTPSTVTFNNTVIGRYYGNLVKATGTLQFKQYPSGALITLN